MFPSFVIVYATSDGNEAYGHFYSSSYGVFNLKFYMPMRSQYFLEYHYYIHSLQEWKTVVSCILLSIIKTII
jgi:hypothetical protein